jgi:hypothetical protein
MAKTFSLTSNSYNGRVMTLSCTQTMNIATNKSSIAWTLTTSGGTNNYYSTGPTTAKINNKQVYYKARTSYSTQAFPAAKGSVSGTTEVTHNSDGSLSIPVSLATAIYTGTVTTKSATWELDKIPRQANITNAPNFNDEENPTIEYNNPAGTAVEKLEACIASEDGETIFVPYRDIAITGTSYTFNLTTAERNALRNATPNSNTLTVKFYVQTTIGGVNFRNSVAKTLTIINNKPTLNPVVKDVGTASTVLTGDANKIIKGANYISVASNGSALKGATIKSQRITCGDAIINAASGSFTNVETAAFTFSITDSRGNVTTQTVNKTLINYVKLSCNMNATISIAGEIDLKLSGNYFNNTFGAVANTLTAEYRYKELNGTYSAWTAASATLNGNKYTTNTKITGLDYRKAYVVQARVTDKITTVTTGEKKLKAIPVFDWGENDFQFNVDAFDKNGNKLGTEITAVNQKAISQSGKQLLESGFVSITPVANTPTSARVNFQRTYKKIPTVVLCPSSSAIGTQVLGAAQTGITTTGVDIVVTRTNTITTLVYFFVFGEAE